MSFTLASTDIQDGGVLPDAQVLAKGNVSPQLSWSGAPEGTRSYAVTCYDPDAPTGSGFWHWTVANIPADVTELAAGAGSRGGGLPKGAIQGRTDFGQAGFGGAAPPAGHGPHRYVFTVFAVDVDSLEVTADDSGAVFGFNLIGDGFLLIWPRLVDTLLGCAIAAGTGAGLYDDMASTGERLVSWHREFTPNPQHRELYQEMMSKWQTVYADQLGLVDSGLTTSMWQAPGLERRQRVASSPSP